jgi:hypothetical protein
LLTIPLTVAVSMIVQLHFCIPSDLATLWLSCSDVTCRDGIAECFYNPLCFQLRTANDICSSSANTFDINPVCLSWSIHCSGCSRHGKSYVWTCSRH